MTYAVFSTLVALTRFYFATQVLICICRVIYTVVSYIAFKLYTQLSLPRTPHCYNVGCFGAEIPVEFVTPLKKVTVTEGQSATLTCQVANVTEDTPVTWLKDGEAIPADSTSVELKSEGPVYSLHLPATVLDDEAEYTIVVGKTQSKAELLVDGK